MKATKITDDVERTLRSGRIRQQREWIRKCGGGIEHITDSKLTVLMDICPDQELLATALLMKPRPAWVVEVTGR
jgi:hypothetical protein